MAASRPVLPLNVRPNTKNPAPARVNYAVDPVTGKFIPHPWPAAKLASLHLPEENIFLTGFNLVGAPVANVNDTGIDDDEFVSLLEKISNAKPITPKVTVLGWVRQVKAWWHHANLEHRVNFPPSFIAQLQALDSLPEETIRLDQIKHVVNHYILPALDAAKPGVVKSEIGGLEGGFRRRRHRRRATRGQKLNRRRRTTRRVR